jgi:cell division transport system permease protein
MRTINPQGEEMTPMNKAKHLYYEHLLAASLGWDRLFRKRFQAMGAVVLIGVSLAVCLAFCFFINVSREFQQDLEATTNLSIFPKENLSQEEYQHLLTTLQDHKILKDIHIHSAQDLAQDLISKEIPSFLWSDWPSIMTASFVEGTPLHTLVTVQKELERNPGVMAVEFDHLWYAKITRIIQVADLVAGITGVVLILSVVLMINYSVRLLMEKYKEEISIMYYLGASTSFIQRPYLYQGLFLGLGGALFAVACLAIPVLLMQEHFSFLYELLEGKQSCLQDEYQQLPILLLSAVAFSLGCSYFSIRKWLNVFRVQMV